MMRFRQRRLQSATTNSLPKSLITSISGLLALLLPLQSYSPFVLAQPLLRHARFSSRRHASQYNVPTSVSFSQQNHNSAEETEPVSVASPHPSCSPNAAPTTQLPNYLHSWLQLASWAEQPEIGISQLIQQFGPQIAAYLNPSPWPTINPKARLAKVPVIMYHDILPQKEVFFDTTPEEFKQELQLIHDSGFTPISLDQLVAHLRTGLPLPEKPILLSFDDGYESAYRYVYPLLKQYGYPAVFSIYTLNIGKNTGREHVTWAQLREMAANPLVTISAHSVTHPHDATVLSNDKLHMEVFGSKRIIESQLGIPIRYFTYPEGKYDARVEKLVQAAGYEAALTMNDLEDRFAGQSKSLLAIDRIGQLHLSYAMAQAWGGEKLPSWGGGFDFSAPIKITQAMIDNNRLIMVSGGRPITIHANSRYQVPQIIAGTNAVAAVDGGFFSMEYLNSNKMIGPVFSQNENKFIPGLRYENIKSTGRPLVLISPQAVKFIPFDPNKHNTLAGIKAEMPNVTDAFIAAAWLVKNNQPQPASSFGSLFDFNAARNRAFWGINQQGQPMLGVSLNLVSSVALGASLAKAGFRDAVMVDSGASSSLAYKGKSLMANLVGYTLRPVPHVVALTEDQTTPQPGGGNGTCSSVRD